jgi:hypothetical protein
MGKGKSKKQKAKSNSPQRRKGRKVRTLPDNLPTGAINISKRKIIPCAPVRFRLPSGKHHRFYKKILSLRSLPLCGEYF